MFVSVCIDVKEHLTGQHDSRLGSLKFFQMHHSVKALNIKPSKHFVL